MADTRWLLAAGVRPRVQRVDGGTRRLRSMLQGRDRGAPPAEASTPATRSCMGGDLESSLRRRAPPPPRASAGGPLAAHHVVSKDLGRPAPSSTANPAQRGAAVAARRRPAQVLAITASTRAATNDCNAPQEAVPKSKRKRLPPYVLDRDLSCKRLQVQRPIACQERPRPRRPLALAKALRRWPTWPGWRVCLPVPCRAC